MFQAFSKSMFGKYLELNTCRNFSSILMKFHIVTNVYQALHYTEQKDKPDFKRSGSMEIISRCIHASKFLATLSATAQYFRYSSFFDMFRVFCSLLIGLIF